MKTRLILLALVAGCHMFAASQEDELKATIDKWRTAVIKKDKATLEKYTSPTVTYSHSNALMEDRAQMIAAMTAPDIAYTAMDMEETKMRFFGKVGVVNTKMTVKNANKGVAQTIPLSVLMVWVKEGSDWKLTARHTTRFPQK